MPDEVNAVDQARARVEEAIVDEERVLGRLLTVICQHVAPESWATDLRETLALALAVDEGNPGEARKARALCRHLAGPDADLPWAAPPPSPSLRQRRRAERVRSDLAGLVRLRALAAWAAPRAATP